ncbi:MAG: Verru_Chthon cassette protein D [Verrucomicrobiota bacterium]
MQSKSHTRFAKSGAFTLVELLTVVGIITLLIALATPTLVDVIRSTRLSSAGDSLLNRLSLAQQEAVARSKEVEMRFYKYTNANSDRPSESLFYAYQVVETPSGQDAKAISEPFYLESGVVFAPEMQLSPLLRTSAVQQREDLSKQYVFTPGSGGDGDDVQYAAIRYYPDGSCRLLNSNDPTATENATNAALAYTVPPLATSFFTLVESQFVGSGKIPPPNYYCIQIDAYTGKARVYRP